MSTALALLVALIGYGLSQTMPLDVAVDAIGVTFAGSTRAWGRITSIERFTSLGTVGPRFNVRVRSEDGDLVLGPTTRLGVEKLGQALTTARAAATS